MVFSWPLIHQRVSSGCGANVNCGPDADSGAGITADSPRPCGISAQTSLGSSSVETFGYAVSCGRGAAGSADGAADAAGCGAPEKTGAGGTSIRPKSKMTIQISTHTERYAVPKKDSTRGWLQKDERTGATGNLKRSRKARPAQNVVLAAYSEYPTPKHVATHLQKKIHRASIKKDSESAPEVSIARPLLLCV